MKFSSCEEGIHLRNNLQIMKELEEKLLTQNSQPDLG